ncbi:MAG: aminoacetone oxidase family FAD-binding enzyme [Vicinamibacteria bacterium]|nr:aminoacetone oxidase family FAD-binding enzyme [Vicinamibacteria bacterium]
MTAPDHDLLVVGAGAAGLFAAIAAAREVPGLRVAAVDGARTLGAKILVSGGGRCNVTNARVTPADFWRPASGHLRHALAAFGVDATRAYFAERGVALHEEEEGKLFPDSNRARSVLDALLAEARERGIALLTGHRVTGLARAAEGFVLTTSGAELRARVVLLATGGRSLPKSGSDGGGYALARGLGHTLIEPVPALEPLLLEGGLHAALSGIALPVELNIRPRGASAVRVRRSLLFTHFGISGPAALDVSRFWRRARAEGSDAPLTLSVLPGAAFADVEAWLLEQGRRRPHTLPAHVLASRVPERLATALAERSGATLPIGKLARESRRALVHALLETPLSVAGGRGWNHAEVTSGGVPLAEVEASTLRSRTCPDLYLAGEILDVDGRLGGFNFQWAWSSAFLAGRAAARAARDRG